MFLFYVDETGNRDPRLEIPQKDGSTKIGDWLYVLTAISLFEHKWHGFEKTINRRKNDLMLRINRDAGLRLTLADCEIKINAIRVPGLYVFPGNSEARDMVEEFEKKRALANA